jgi:cytochrome c oxidase subunit 2
VIHDFANPAFGLKTDAVPGKANETWFKAEKPGVYYGQCDQLCGVNHAFMPIEIDVVDQGKFNAWVGAHGGKIAGATPAPAAPPAAAAVPAADAKKTADAAVQAGLSSRS